MDYDIETYRNILKEEFLNLIYEFVDNHSGRDELSIYPYAEKIVLDVLIECENELRNSIGDKK